MAPGATHRGWLRLQRLPETLASAAPVPSQPDGDECTLLGDMAGVTASRDS
eukprot:CAMPEP_0171224552 /NCGR_PEP_ID=MMETSP0790-20130122/36349_1 /TAXON_ID=2925 /ORGANISM="Alexandrium catenella, Strain OF101" /LENGTH=50 /DNA_ID=CAMNT_0011690555 /DNA_START=192 /DNA_END=344 /DNA_ORIENTATION=+